MSEEVNKWVGTWKTKDGTIVEIVPKSLNGNIVLGRIINNKVVTCWDNSTGNHLEDFGLDLMSRKRDEEHW